VAFPTGSIENDRLVLTYRQRTGGIGAVGVDYTAGGVTYTVEVTDELGGTWQSGTSLVELVPGSVVNNGDGTETVSVRLKLPVTSAPMRFARLVLTPAP